MLVRDLLDEIPPDTSDVVARTCSAWSKKVRSQLTNSFLRWGLQHHRGRETRSATLRNRWGSVGRPIEWAPPILDEMPIPEGFERAARLSVYAPASETLVSASKSLIELFRSGEQTKWTDTRVNPEMALFTLQAAVGLGEDLQRLASPPLAAGHPGEKFDLVRYVLAVDEDVLGAFRYDPTDLGPDMHPSPSGDIVVYWGVVGLVARALGVSTAALAVVVLAHELAHGHLHLGHDRDGNRWSGEHFAVTEVDLHEALAQYYTHHICVQLDGLVPGLSVAYWNLLERQPAVYQLHLPLVLHSTPEQVASALAGLRAGPATYIDLIERLGIGAALSGTPEHWRNEARWIGVY